MRKIYEFSLDFKAHGNFTVLADNEVDAEEEAQEEVCAFLHSFEAGDLDAYWDIDFVREVVE